MMRRRNESAHRTAAGIIAGSIAGVAFLIAMALDIFVTRSRANDLRLLAGVVPGLGRFWLVLGTAIHQFNSAIIGVIYAHIEHRFSGPSWMKGTLFTLVENTVLWPIIMLLDRVHPEIKSGDLPKFNRPLPIVQEIFRHVVYGVVLGWTYEQLRR